MKTKLIILFLAFFSSHLQAQFSVTMLPNNQMRINNGNCATAFRVRMPDLSYYTTPAVQPDSSITIEVNPCGWGQVIPLVSCTEAAPKGLEFYSCLEVLATGEKIKWTEDKEGKFIEFIEVWIPVGLITDSRKIRTIKLYCEFENKLGYRDFEIPLNKVIGGYYYHVIKL